jgi:hypothetical protein
MLLRLACRARVLVVSLVCGGCLLAVSGPASAAPAEFRGVFRPVIVDARSGGDVQYTLEADNGRVYRLRGTGAWRKSRAGTRLSVIGDQSGSDIDVRSASVLKAAPSAPAAPVTGTRSLLVINVVWSGTSLTATKAEETAFLFGTTDPARRSTKQYYQDVSYGQLNWTGTVTDTLTIEAPNGCDSTGIANAADSAATSAGYNPSNYQHVMYNFPDPGCSAAGFGQAPGRRSWIVDGLWNIGDGYSRMTPAHELGHNIGEQHGHGLQCGTAVVTASCLASTSSLNEYGNSYDLMGNNWTSDPYDAINWMALPHSITLGWLSASGRVASTTDPGSAATQSFVIKPIEASGGTVGLVLDTPAHRYFLETRSAVSQDAFLTNFPSATSGLLISMRNDLPGGDTGALNLDTKPDSCSDQYDFCEFNDAPLQVGQTLTDVDSNFTLKLDSKDTNGAAFHINWHGGKAPAITSVFPTAGAANVSATTNLYAVFDHAMNKSTTAAAFSLKRTSNGASVPGSVVWFGDAPVFIPNGPLDGGAQYTATISTAATDLDGRHLPAARTWSFTTSTVPVIKSVSPIDGASDVFPNANVVAVFNEPMDKPSTAGAFTLRRTSNGAAVAGSVVWFGDAAPVFIPSSDLQQGVQYTATISSSARSSGGTPLPAIRNWNFTVTTRPVLERVNPLDGATGVPTNSPVYGVFSEAMDRGSTMGAFTLKRTSTGAAVPGSFSWFGESVPVFTPSSPLAPGTQYTATISGAARDLSGATVANPTTWRFTTGASGAAPLTRTPTP